MKIADLTISWNPDDTELGSGFYDEILSVNKPTTRYFYDGQMPMEEDFKITGGFGSPTVTVTQYGLGARGIDYIRNKVGNDPETIVFPIYDGHGNMVYTLSRGANDAFSLGNKRMYGAWGDLRYDGNPNAGPNTQYVGNLGHKKDNESGLTYMRARYYEPWTGRFVSEDPIEDGVNYYIYATNDPVNRADIDGQDDALTYLNKVLRFFFFDPRVSNMSLEQLKKSINTAISNLLAKAKVHGELANYWFAESVAVMTDTPITNHLNEVQKARLAELMQASGARHKAVQTAYLLGASQLRLLLIIIEIGERW
jgi:RHS repeat-associated protein